jgi:hypothetical protein
VKTARVRAKLEPGGPGGSRKRDGSFPSAFANCGKVAEKPHFFAWHDLCIVGVV